MQNAFIESNESEIRANAEKHLLMLQEIITAAHEPDEDGEYEGVTSKEWEAYAAMLNAYANLVK